MLEDDVLVRYRKVLKLGRDGNDYYVPSNEDVLSCYTALKENEDLELIFLILATSGIRFVECLDFLKTFDVNKFKINDGFVSYSVANNRKTKNINTVFLPLFVYEKLKRITGSNNRLQDVYNKKATFNAKYLRKWQYNFLLYNGVPEGVADFIQGRASNSIGANHYLAKNQQAEFWYKQVAKKLSEVLLLKEKTASNSIS
ncbi:hypothetical protein JXA48_01740 [Candidatus Woesearchaeota archaeon]|nr:hypothetical protein [Candidatus Woesearchaeota archaeon]